MTAPQQQKLKITGPVVVTANRLGDGAVVYLDRQGGWSTDLADAAVTTRVEEARALLTQGLADDINAVGAYIAPVLHGEGGTLRPGNLREQIRLKGPTFALPSAAGL
jgi:hypothetical protein